jgi:selenocysteine-specific elongation factor
VAAGLLEPDEVAAAVGELTAGGALVQLDGGFLQSRAGYAAVAAEVSARLAERARAEPLSPGLPPGALVRSGPGRDALLARLERDGIFEREGALAVAPGTRASSAAVAEAAAALVAALAAEPFAPPRLEDVAAGLALDPAAARALVAVLEAEGAIVRLPDGLAVTRAAFDEARAAVVAACERQGRVTLAELRDATGSSRRYAQALLERLDGDGVTRRIGDHRVLRRARAG